MLYDTGASVSCFPQSWLAEYERKKGPSRIFGRNPTLVAATGTSFKNARYYKCDVTAHHSTKNCTLIAVEENCAILGINLINTFQLHYNATTGKIMVPRKKVQAHRKKSPRTRVHSAQFESAASCIAAVSEENDDVILTIARTKTVPAGTTQWLKVHVRPHPSSNLKNAANLDIIASIQGMSQHIVTDAHCNCTFPFTNIDDEDRKYARSEVVGSGEIVPDLLSQSCEISDLPEIMAKNAEHIASMDISSQSEPSSPSITRAQIAACTKHISNPKERQLIKRIA